MAPYRNNITSLHHRVVLPTCLPANVRDYTFPALSVHPNNHKSTPSSSGQETTPIPGTINPRPPGAPERGGASPIPTLRHLTAPPRGVHAQTRTLRALYNRLRQALCRGLSVDTYPVLRSILHIEMCVVWDGNNPSRWRYFLIYLDGAYLRTPIILGLWLGDRWVAMYERHWNSSP